MYLKTLLEQEQSLSLADVPAEGIKEIQEILQKLKYLDGAIDGICGDRTKDAYLRFKRDNELTLPDRLGPTTARELLDAAEEPHPVNQEQQQSGIVLPKEVLGSKTGNSMRLPSGRTVWANELILPDKKIPLTWGEMTKNCTRVPTTKEVEGNIEIITKEFGEIRDKAGVPIVLNSGFRPESVNRAIGGARLSQHVQGLAIDIAPANGSGISLHKLYEIVCGVAKTGGIGKGMHRGFVHRDRRPNRSVVIFNY